MKHVKLVRGHRYTTLDSGTYTNERTYQVTDEVGEQLLSAEVSGEPCFAEVKEEKKAGGVTKKKKTASKLGSSKDSEAEQDKTPDSDGDTVTV